VSTGPTRSVSGTSGPSALTTPPSPHPHPTAINAHEEFGYGWLDPYYGPGIRVTLASCFSFFDGVSVSAVVDRAHLRGTRTVDLSHGSNALEHFFPFMADLIAVFRLGDWTVVWQENGYPDQFANRVASMPDVSRAVIVFWNVNADQDFSYWENGRRLVDFDYPDDRIGTDPDRLLAPMQDTVLKPRAPDEGRTAIPDYRRMLALADRVTGVHLGPDFLNRESVVIHRALGQ
jgi:hypothetical protein